MTRICHVTSAHKRYDVRIFRKECCSLAKNGHDCYLVVNDNLENEERDGVKIVSTGLEVSSRRERFTQSHKLLFEKMKKINADIYHFHDPDLLSLAFKIKKKGKKVIFDFHENVAKQIKDKSWIPEIVRNITSFLYSKYEKHYAKKFDYLITVSPNIVDVLKYENKKVKMITNFPIIEESYQEPSFDKKNICFVGGISEQWCQDIILKAISEIDDCKYLLAGQSSEKYLETLKNSPGWSKVKFLGKIPFEQVSDVYNQSMAGLALNISTQVGKEGTLGNTKLFEYMQAGLPIICSDNLMWKKIVEEHDCGIIVNPENCTEIQNAIRYIFKHAEKAKEMGRNGRDAVINMYSWEKEAKKLYSLYEELIG